MLSVGIDSQTARAVCESMVRQASEGDEEQSLATSLLTDIRDVFARKEVAFLASTDLVGELRRIEEAPWDDFDLNARKLARRLSQFGIKPGHNSTKTARGYALEAFSDAFAHYIRPEPSEPSGISTEQQQCSDGSESSDGSIRPGGNIRPGETTAQDLFGTDLTDSDAPPHENSHTCRYCFAALTADEIERGHCPHPDCRSEADTANNGARQ